MEHSNSEILIAYVWLRAGRCYEAEGWIRSTHKDQEKEKESRLCAAHQNRLDITRLI